MQASLTVGPALTSRDAAGPRTSVAWHAATTCRSRPPTRCSPWLREAPRPAGWRSHSRGWPASSPTSSTSMIDVRANRTSTRAAFVAVVAASDSLGRFCITEPGRIEVLADLDQPVDTDWTRRALAGSDPPSRHPAHRGTRPARARLVRRGHARSFRVRFPGPRGVRRARRSPSNGELAVIGMGKLGGGELNYASDVDFMFVTAPPANDDRREACRGRREAFVPGRHRPPA